MAIVAISQSLGSLGDEMGRALASAVGYEFADREIILEAASRFGEGVGALAHVTEEKPTLWERVADTQRHYLTFIESIVLEMATRDNVVLSGRGAPFILRDVPHVLRVRFTAPVAVRARRVAASERLAPALAEDLVKHADHDRAARIRFLYQVHWEDPLLYDLIINTERISAPEASRMVASALAEPARAATPESHGALRDRSLVARSKAALLVDAQTQHLHVTVTCRDGRVRVSGVVDDETQRSRIQQIVGGIPGVSGVDAGVSIAPPARFSV
jgi:cytidylate kinase